MIGREYRHPKLGKVVVIEYPNYKAGGPRNVLIHTEQGDLIVVPQRSLRRRNKMDIKVNLEAEDINKEIREAIAKSAIGVELKRAMDKKVKEFSESYRNPLEGIVSDEIVSIVRALVEKEYLPQIKKFIAEKMTDEFVKDLLGKLWEKFINRY